MCLSLSIRMISFMEFWTIPQVPLEFLRLFGPFHFNRGSNCKWISRNWQTTKKKSRKIDSDFQVTFPGGAFDVISYSLPQVSPCWTPPPPVISVLRMAWCHRSWLRRCRRPRVGGPRKSQEFHQRWGMKLPKFWDTRPGKPTKSHWKWSLKLK